MSRWAGRALQVLLVCALTLATLFGPVDAQAQRDAELETEYQHAVQTAQDGEVEQAAAKFAALLERLPEGHALATLSIYGAARSYQQVETSAAACEAVDLFTRFIGQKDAEADKRERASKALPDLIARCSLQPVKEGRGAGERVTRKTERLLDEAEADDARARTDPASRGGLYGGAHSTLGTPVAGSVRATCEDTISCAYTTALGYGAVLQLGYSFGLAAVELTANGEYALDSLERRYGDVAGSAVRASDSGVQRLENFDYGVVTAGGGLAGRVAVGSGAARFTSSLGVGAAYKRHSMERKISQGVTDSLRRVVDSLSPAARFEMGVLIGSPGVASAAITSWVRAEFTPEDAVTSAIPNDAVVSAPAGVNKVYTTPSYALSSGPHVSAGLSLGMFFGL